MFWTLCDPLHSPLPSGKKITGLEEGQRDGQGCSKVSGYGMIPLFSLGKR